MVLAHQILWNSSLLQKDSSVKFWFGNIAQDALVVTCIGRRDSGCVDRNAVLPWLSLQSRCYVSTEAEETATIEYESKEEGR
jgi:hypothetical protein